MLSLARHIPQSHAALKRGEFTQADNAAAATQQGLRRDVVWDVSPESPYEVFKAVNCAIKRWGWWGMATLAAGWRVSPGVRHGGVGGGSVRRRRGYQ
ncbi:putative d-3-phosphoglycerate dehydrogenase SerA1 [Klebsiella pneumoniae]|nr:putative d-3-phosphoglycerate dehydrogenase SerA1 [Klebsiella pneumoniae]